MEPFNLWFQSGCFFAISSLIVNKIVGILKDNNPSVPPRMFRNHCKVRPTSIASPMKRLARGLVGSTAGSFLEDFVEYLVFVHIDWMHLGETERLLPLDWPSNNWVWLIYQERRMWRHDCRIISKKIFDGGLPCSKHLASMNRNIIIPFGNSSVLSKLGNIGTLLLGLFCHWLAFDFEVIQHHPAKVGRSHIDWDRVIVTNHPIINLQTFEGLEQQK